MKLLRRIHMLAGCLFAPLLIYFALSGAWQTLGWQDAERGEKNIYHELSNPHLNQALPGTKGPAAQSALFGYFAVAMALGFCLTAGLGIILAFRFSRPKWLVALVLALGIFIPLLLLFLAAHGMGA